MNIRILELAATALTSKDPDDIWVAADDLLAFVEKGNADFIPPLFAVLDALAGLNINAAIGIAKAAVYMAPSGSQFQHQAVERWTKYVDVLSAVDASAATAESGYIASVAVSDSMLGRSVAALGYLVPTQPASNHTAETSATQAINTFMGRFG